LLTLRHKHQAHVKNLNRPVKEAEPELDPQ
jgi:hypothetical protein